MNNLVQRLCEQNQPVEVSLRPARTLEAFKAAIGRQFVHVRFTGTQGGTELGFRLDKDRSDLSALDTLNGTVTLAGTLTLNYEPIRCIANIDVATLQGQGHLEPVVQITSPKGA